MRRDTTERPEGVKAGTLKLVGTEVGKGRESMLELLENKEAYDRWLMPRIHMEMVMPAIES